MIADFNGDGEPDVAISNFEQNTIAICVASFCRILDDERTASEQVLPGDFVAVLVLRVVKFTEESRAQRNVNIARVAQPV